MLQALMDRDGDNPNSLAARVRQRIKQPQIYKFLNGISKEPKRSTLQPLADHYGITVEAFYDPELAQAVVENLRANRPLMTGVGRLDASLPMVTAELRDEPSDAFSSKGALTALANTIASVPEILQPTARDALIKWASNQSTFEQLVAAIDALARANQPMPEEKSNAPSSPDDWRPIQQSEPAVRKRIRNPPGDQRRTQDGGS